MNKKVHVKTGDTVIIMSGRERGKQGKVLAVSPEEGKVIIEGRNMVTKHVKPRRMGEQGGIVKAEGAMYACKVQVLCPHCNKPTRVQHNVHFEEIEGKQKRVSERVCAKCKQAL